ncbi:hypothetical protein [Streptomyces sp. NRRL F-5065]|uniref:hypothetical protein n=1 Tax=Streptomyces sp. NRRL F-5065 TaxID=1463855 RepID=UPI0004C0EE2C|nr:hypothetical protein [Streptomyces sp. NRRL F-5065]
MVRSAGAAEAAEAEERGAHHEQADRADTERARAELPAYLVARHTKPQGLAGAEFTEPDPARVVHTVERALADRLPTEQSAALHARLNLDAIKPGLRETLAGPRREVDGTVDQQAAPLSAA